MVRSAIGSLCGSYFRRAIFLCRAESLSLLYGNLIYIASYDFISAGVFCLIEGRISAAH